MKDLEEIRRAQACQKCHQAPASSIDGQISTDVTFDQWMKSRPVSEQIEVLGKGRQKLYGGKLTLADMLTRNKGNELESIARKD